MGSSLETDFDVAAWIQSLQSRPDRVARDVQRNAMVREDHDPMRVEFVVALTDTYQPELASLPVALSDQPEADPRVVVGEWLRQRRLFAKWFVELIIDTPARMWRTVGLPVKFWPNAPPFETEPTTEDAHRKLISIGLGEEFVRANKERVDAAIRQRLAEEKMARPPVREAITPPRPWIETEASFFARCQLAWDQNAAWARQQGLRKPRSRRRKGRSQDPWPAYLDTFLENRLRKVPLERLIARCGLGNARTLAARHKEIKKRLEIQ
jgi:hypothetical protein